MGKDIGETEAFIYIQMQSSLKYIDGVFHGMSLFRTWVFMPLHNFLIILALSNV